MATKTISWGKGSGNITLTYTGQGNGSVSVKSDANDLYEERVKSITIKTSKGSPQVTKTVTVKQKGKSLGWTTKDFDYTGGVQSIELPAGKYKLQCWGAQGGTSYGNSNGVGSKGGYSEGVLTLTETTTLYVFVGGKGSNGSSTSLVNGGWNGGGASVGYSSYNSGGENGYSYPACGGGATDICTVTSSMSYSSGRTNRSSASLLSRIIVAGGGAGGSYRYTSKETTTTTTTSEPIVDGTLGSPSYASTGAYYESTDRTLYRFTSPSNVLSAGMQIEFSGLPSGLYSVTVEYYDSNNSYKSFFATLGDPLKTVPSDYNTFISFLFAMKGDTTDTYTNEWFVDNIIIYKKVQSSTTTTENSSGYSNKSQQGGGTSGKGQYPGTQTSAGSGGEFGFGANQTSTNYRYCAGGGGGGWYGGGTDKSDSSTSYVNYTGGGSGFVNTAANASSRPSGYTGLQLDSGTTKAGNTSHPSTSGGTETGHSGNGYAKITVIS
jgi:hypothetical protein